MKAIPATARAGLRATWLLSCVRVLLGTPLASAAPPPTPAAATLASALAQVAANAQPVQSNSRKFEHTRALANARLQAGTEALQKLTAADPKSIYLAIAAARDEFQAALEIFTRLPALNEEIVASIAAMESAIDLARARQNAAPFEIAQIERAEKLLASARSVSQPASQFVDSELSIARDAANTHLAELAAIERAQVDANRKNSGCDIHDIGVESFEYPVVLWQPILTQPWFNANNGGYRPHAAQYADLDGNGRIEAIVQLTQGSTTTPVGDCYFRGRGAIFVFEMDEKCVVQRLAWIKGTSHDSARIRGKTLLVDQPYFAPTGHFSGGAASCKQAGVQHFAWQFQAGKLRRTNTGLAP